MTRIAFFGHDSGDAAVRRRVRAFRDDGFDVIGFTMRRRDEVTTEWQNVVADLSKQDRFFFLALAPIDKRGWKGMGAGLLAP